MSTNISEKQTSKSLSLQSACQKMELRLPQTPLQGEKENKSDVSWAPTAADTAFATTCVWIDQSRTTVWSSEALAPAHLCARLDYNAFRRWKKSPT